MMLILTSKELCQSYGGGKMTLNIMSMPLIMMAMVDENWTVEAFSSENKSERVRKKTSEKVKGSLDKTVEASSSEKESEKVKKKTSEKS